MKYLILLLGLGTISLSTFSQIKINPNNAVRIGDFNNVGAQTVPLQITHDTYFQCLPSESGVKIRGYAIGSDYVPMFRPQWNNTFFMGASDRMLWNTYSHNIYYNNLWQLSDSTLKRNIDTLSKGLAEIKRLRPVVYDIELPNDSTPASRIKEMKEQGKDNMGLIAQEFQLVFPKLVQLDTVNNKYLVNYTGLIPVLVKAMQEQQAKIDELEIEINALKNK